MMVGSLRALARGLVFAASLVVPALGLTPAQAQQQPQGDATQAAPFAFQRLDIDQSGLQPVVCLRFTGALRGEGVRYSDYLAIAPDPRPGLRVEGQALCLTGLSYGSDYEIDLRQGLPGAGDRALAASERVGVTLSARPPVVAFAGGGRILVRAASDGLPVTTVNVPEVALRVYRVGEYGSAAVREQFRQNERRAYPWALDQMANETGRLVWSGVLATENPPNREVVTSFPLAEAIPARQPGIYWVVAYDAARVSAPRKLRWIVISRIVISPTVAPRAFVTYKLRKEIVHGPPPHDQL